MLAPMGVLAIGAVAAGFMGAEGTGTFHEFLTPVFSSTFAQAAAYSHGSTIPEVGFWAHYGLLIVSGGLSLLGILAAYLVYVKEPWIPGLVRASIMPIHRVLWNKYYVDEFYDRVIVRPARSMGRFCVGLDDYVVDGLIWLVTAVVRLPAYLLRGLQRGVLQAYAVGMVIGLAILLLIVL
jgi:NADH-quinone oxidoreductase subunit L